MRSTEREWDLYEENGVVYRIDATRCKWNRPYLIWFRNCVDDSWDLANPWMRKFRSPSTKLLWYSSNNAGYIFFLATSPDAPITKMCVDATAALGFCWAGNIDIDCVVSSNGFIPRIDPRPRVGSCVRFVEEIVLWTRSTIESLLPEYNVHAVYGKGRITLLATRIPVDRYTSAVKENTRAWYGWTIHDPVALEDKTKVEL